MCSFDSAVWRRALVVALILAAAPLSATVAQVPATGDTASVLQGDASAFQGEADQAAGSYQFSIDQQHAQLVARPVLRWSNPVGGNWDGRVYLWTAAGRPAVIASIYKAFHRDGQPVTHEFHSLTDQLLVAVRDAQTVWQAKEAIGWRPIPDSEQVVPSARLALVQMRALARKFSVTKTHRDETLRTLRLLPEPVYRYKTNDAEQADGALFVFAQTTDPEVLLLIESRDDCWATMALCTRETQ